MLKFASRITGAYAPIIIGLGFVKGFVAISFAIVAGVFLLSCCGWQITRWITGKPPQLI